MARQAVTTTQLSLTGVKATSTGGIADGFKVSNPKGHVVVLARNNHSTLARNVTIQSAFQKKGLDLADQVVSVPAKDHRLIGLIDRETFNHPAGDADAGSFFIDFEPGAEGDLELELYEMELIDMADELDQEIREAAASPRKVSNDEISAENHSLKDVIEADKYLASKGAVKKKTRGLRFSKIAPPGTA